MEVTQLPFPLSSLQSVHQARSPEMLHKWQPSGAVVNPEAVEVSGVQGVARPEEVEAVEAVAVDNKAVAILKPWKVHATSTLNLGRKHGHVVTDRIVQ